VGLAALAGLGGSLASRRDPGVGAPPAVSAAPRPLAAAPAPAPAAPADVLERLPVSRAALAIPVAPEARAQDDPRGGRLIERVALDGSHPGLRGPLDVEYTLDGALTHEVFRILERGRVALGHVIVMNPGNGRVLAYASTDTERFPPTRAYPAASLVKIITAAAALDSDPDTARLPCRFSGSPYRLTPARIDPPKRGSEVSLRRALATSNNQCFAQLAVHAVGGDALVDAISRFGWLAPPAPAHAAGRLETGEDRYDVARLGCGLAGCRITPLHAVQLAATLVRGELVAPRWIDRVLDAEGRELPLPAAAAPRQVLTPELADQLRAMLVETTVSGTARRAFRRRNGRPLLGAVTVAGKTGSLSDREPKGRYEWFAGVAPADRPRIAIAVLVVQDGLWWRNASQVAAEVLEQVFCQRGACAPELAERWTPAPVTGAPASGGGAGAVLR
jgi:cell division protein FtsI/penicillin-binding protein 2